MACAEERAFLTVPLGRSVLLDKGILDLEFPWPGPAPAPGQFFLVRPRRSSVFLGRPISVYAWEPPAATAPPSPAGTLRFLVAVRGRGTAELAELREGEAVELSGPLGKAWPLSGTLTDETAAVAVPGRPVALVGGGIGVAPVAFLAAALAPASYDFYAGFRSRPYGLNGLRSRTTVIATEDGCEGSRGRIPDFLDCAAYAAVYACGPEPMLRAVAASCAAAGTPCYLSLERRMACGVGACLGCTVRTTAGNKRCCADGPVFDSREVIFDA